MGGGKLGGVGCGIMATVLPPVVLVFITPLCVIPVTFPVWDIWAIGSVVVVVSVEVDVASVV